MRTRCLVVYTCLFLFHSSCDRLDIPKNSEFSFKCSTSSAHMSASKYNLVLIIGQSNTFSGIGFDSSLDIADGRVKQLGRFGDNNLKVIDAIEPLEHHTPTQGRIGFGLVFSNLFVEYLVDDGDSLIIIPCGYGGTGFRDKQWNKNNPLYNDAINRVNLVHEIHPESELKVILWHQGEKDVGNPDYEFLLDNFINNLRTDLGYPDVPFILGGMVPYWVQQDQARIDQQNILASTKDRITNVGYADPNQPSIIEKEDNNYDAVHFNAAGQREMGNRYFDAFLCSINE